jgi:hypothetical protein
VYSKRRHSQPITNVCGPFFSRAGSTSSALVRPQPLPGAALAVSLARSAVVRLVGPALQEWLQAGGGVPAATIERVQELLKSKRLVEGSRLQDGDVWEVRFKGASQSMTRRLLDTHQCIDNCGRALCWQGLTRRRRGQCLSWFQRIRLLMRSSSGALLPRSHSLLRSYYSELALMQYRC